MTYLEELTIKQDTVITNNNDTLYVDFQPFQSNYDEHELHYWELMMSVLKIVLSSREDLQEVTITRDSVVTLNHIPASGGFGAARVFSIDGRLFDYTGQEHEIDDLKEFLEDIVIPILNENDEENMINVELQDKAERRALLPH